MADLEMWLTFRTTVNGAINDLSRLARVADSEIASRSATSGALNKNQLPETRAARANEDTPPDTVTSPDDTGIAVDLREPITPASTPTAAALAEKPVTKR